MTIKSKVRRIAKKIVEEKHEFMWSALRILGALSSFLLIVFLDLVPTNADLGGYFKSLSISSAYVVLLSFGAQTLLFQKRVSNVLVFFYRIVIWLIISMCASFFIEVHFAEVIYSAATCFIVICSFVFFLEKRLLKYATVIFLPRILTLVFAPFVTDLFRFDMYVAIIFSFGLYIFFSFTSPLKDIRPVYWSLDSLKVGFSEVVTNITGPAVFYLAANSLSGASLVQFYASSRYAQPVLLLGQTLNQNYYRNIYNNETSKSLVQRSFLSIAVIWILGVIAFFHWMNRELYIVSFFGFVTFNFIYMCDAKRIAELYHAVKPGALFKVCLVNIGIISLVLYFVDRFSVTAFVFLYGLQLALWSIWSRLLKYSWGHSK